MTKICVKCKEIKNLSEFRKDKISKDGRRSECKKCRNSYMQIQRRNPDGRFAKMESIRRKKYKNQGRERNREIVNNIKKKGCSICGYNKSLKALHFHHTADNKKYDVGWIVAEGLSYDLLIKEIDKCILVCSNCHHEMHDKIIYKFAEEL